MTDEVRDLRSQDLPKPGDQLPLAASVEVREIPMRVEERILHEIGSVDLALEAPADLHTGEEAQVVAVDLEKRSESGLDVRLCREDSLLGIDRTVCHGWLERGHEE